VQRVTLTGYLAVLRRRFVVLIVCLIAGSAGAALQVHHTTKEYAATATYFVSLPASTSGDVNVQQNAISVISSFMKSFQQLASKRSTADAVAESLGIDPGLVAGHLASSVEDGTFYVDVTAIDTDPSQARVLADAAATTIVAEIPKIQGVSKNPAGAYITDRAQLPTVPFQPTPRNTYTLGILLGLVGGIALIALLEALDRSVRHVEQLTALAGKPLLGLIPRRKGAAANRLLVTDADAEPYRALRTAVSFLNPDDPPVTILITSPMPGDGKTTTAANLAKALADAGEKVLLLDADLRRARLSRSFGLPRELGITSVITREVTLEGALLTAEVLDVLPAGRVPPNPSELLGSQSMRAILEAVRERYDVVIIDAPPVLAVTDAVVLAPLVDATVLVVQHGKTRRAALSESVRRLAAVGSPTVGVVLNYVPRAEAGDYYGKYVYTPV
jgi:capsular exopolysaccharide synthesis family protein